MEGELESFMHLLQSEKKWVLSVVEHDNRAKKTKLCPVTFHKTIPPEFARWLVLEMTKPDS